jgi:signal peptidase II
MVFSVQRRRWLVPLVIGVVVVLYDQLTKRWILDTLGPEPMQRSILLIDNWLAIVYSRNTGIAFGFLQHMSPILTIVSLFISVGAIYVYIVYLPNYSWWVQVSIGLIIGGALGNIIDRILLGYVVDFIQVGWWPVFNLADSSITVGATILAVYLMFSPDETRDMPSSHDEALLQELLHQDVSSLERDRQG